MRDIVTHFDNPPIPTRESDWSAVTKDYDPERDDPIGRGATEHAAIDDLIAQLDDASEAT